MRVAVLVGGDGSHFGALEFIGFYYTVSGGMLDDTFALHIVIEISKGQGGK
jgi:hypothetical protein